MPKNNNEIKTRIPGYTLGIKCFCHRILSIMAALFAVAFGIVIGVCISGDPKLDVEEMRTHMYVHHLRQFEDFAKSTAMQIAQADKVVSAEIVTVSDKMEGQKIAYKPNQWIIDKAGSTLSFEAVQYGHKFNGSFDFDGEIIFNPKNLDDCSVSIEIDINSIATGSLNRDSRARTKDWFDAGQFPAAKFKSAAFSNGEKEGEYVAHGVLGVRGVDVPVDLPFSLRFYEDEKGSVPVDNIDVLDNNFMGPTRIEGSANVSAEVETQAEVLQENDKNKLAEIRAEMLAQISLSLSDFRLGQDMQHHGDALSDKVGVFIVLQAHMPNGD